MDQRTGDTRINSLSGCVALSCYDRNATTNLRLCQYSPHYSIRRSSHPIVLFNNIHVGPGVKGHVDRLDRYRLWLSLRAWEGILVSLDPSVILSGWVTSFSSISVLLFYRLKAFFVGEIEIQPCRSQTWVFWVPVGCSRATGAMHGIGSEYPQTPCIWFSGWISLAFTLHSHCTCVDVACMYGSFNVLYCPPMCSTCSCVQETP